MRSPVLELGKEESSRAAPPALDGGLSDKEVKSGFVQETLDDELLKQVDVDDQLTISLPPDTTNNQQPQFVDDMFQASFAELLQMPQVDWVRELIETMRPMVEKAHELDIDEPYSYYGRIRW